MDLPLLLMVVLKLYPVKLLFVQMLELVMLLILRVLMLLMLLLMLLMLLLMLLMLLILVLRLLILVLLLVVFCVSVQPVHEIPPAPSPPRLYHSIFFDTFVVAYMEEDNDFQKDVFPTYLLQHLHRRHLQRRHLLQYYRYLYPRNHHCHLHHRHHRQYFLCHSALPFLRLLVHFRHHLPLLFQQCVLLHHFLCQHHLHHRLHR
jgi:hypothetical protein